MREEEVDNPELEKALAVSGMGKKQLEQDKTPVYRKFTDSRIPVSKHMGMLWCSRKDAGIKAGGDSSSAWEEAIAYYCNDQSGHRDNKDNESGNTLYARRLNKQWTETENIVFANCSIMVPMLYQQNPNITVSSDNDLHEQFCKTIERLGNKLMSMKTGPGLNFKNKMRRTILTTLLTNKGGMKIGWTDKVDSDESAQQQLIDLAMRLEKAKSKKEIKEIEGELMALEEKVSMLSPSGPWARAFTPDRVVVDPTSVEPDGADAMWMMEWDYLPTSYINAVYATKQGDEYKSIYQPTHVMHVDDKKALEDTVNNFSLLQDEGELKAATYGYKNEASFKAAQHTKVWYVWDKTTRRVMMFADNNWKWPIWVWDDPLNLPRFFPYFFLWFHESPNTNSPRGEVNYYLDQQDAINEINDELRRSRKWARRNVFYDKNKVSQADVEAVLKGDDGTARGIDVPEGMKVDDLIFSLTPPAIRVPELFSVDSKLAAINRISGINEAQRGAQFKTNTTNRAVESYNQTANIRTEERIDLIEDFIGDIMWNVLMLCLMKWDKEDVEALVGTQYAASWKRLEASEFNTDYHMRVEGGSVSKPNSETKKKMAMELAQVLGQFANAAPALVIIMLKMIERSFNEVVINDEEWAMVMETMQMALTKAGSGPGGEAEQTDQGTQTAQSDEQLKEQLRQQIASLPPQAQQELEALVQQGVPPAEALQQIQAQLETAASS